MERCNKNSHIQVNLPKLEFLLTDHLHHGSRNLLLKHFAHVKTQNFSQPYVRFRTFLPPSLSQSAQKIKEENGGGTIVTVNDGEEGSLEADEMEALEAFLPLAKKQQVGAKANGECSKSQIIRHV